MATIPTVLDTPARDLGRREPPIPPRDGGDGRGGNGGYPSGSSRAEVAVLGIWVALAPILMLFLAFVSAYVVRRGLGQDWSAVPVPRLLWLNTGVLLASSFLLEPGRADLQRSAGARGWFAATLLCGVLFVCGQYLGWREWWGRGIHIGSSAYTSFFYLLTGAHAVHLSLGLLALGANALWPAHGWGGMTRTVLARVTAVYWHFMGALWVGLFLVLNFWR